MDFLFQIESEPDVLLSTLQTSGTVDVWWLICSGSEHLRLPYSLLLQSSTTLGRISNLVSRHLSLNSSATPRGTQQSQA